MFNPYIDVRPTWPTLILGQAAVTLRGCDRSITVQQAVDHLLGEDVISTPVVDLNSQRSEAISTDLNLPISTE